MSPEDQVKLAWRTLRAAMRLQGVRHSHVPLFRLGYFSDTPAFYARGTSQPETPPVPKYDDATHKPVGPVPGTPKPVEPLDDDGPDASMGRALTPKEEKARRRANKVRALRRELDKNLKMLDRRDLTDKMRMAVSKRTVSIRDRLAAMNALGPAKKGR